MSEWKDKLQGKAREMKGKVTGDKIEELKGKAQETWGAAEGKIDDLKGSLDRRASQESANPDADPTYSGEGYQADDDRAPA